MTLVIVELCCLGQRCVGIALRTFHFRFVVMRDDGLVEFLKRQCAALALASNSKQYRILWMEWFGGMDKGGMREEEFVGGRREAAWVGWCRVD